MTVLHPRRLLLPLSALPLLWAAPAGAQTVPFSISEVRAAPSSPEEGEPVALAVVVQNASGRDLTYTWDPGDGSEPASGAGLSSLTHRFRDDGNFTVTVTAHDGEGGTAEATTRVTVRNAAPEIEAVTASPDARRDEPVELESVARDPGVDDVLTYRWDFGDGATAEGADLHTTSHSFSEPGLHTVTLVVEDGDGGSATEVILVPVERTFEFTFSELVGGEMTGGFDNRPGVMVLTSESTGSSLPPGTCQLLVQGTADQGEYFALAATLPAPVRPDAVPAVDDNDVPGTATMQVTLGCDRPGVDCSGGMPRFRATSGTLTLTRTSPGLVEGRIDVSGETGLGPARLAGAFVAGTSRVFGVPIAPGEAPCFPTGTLLVESTAPAPDAENVDFEETEVRVALSQPFDPSTLDPTSFRLEYRLPDDPGGGVVATEAYHEVEGVLEATGEADFRFVPREALLDGVIYRATVVGGSDGLRGAAGEEMDDDRSWRFSTTVEPEGVRTAAFQVARNAPLVPGKTTLTRVYVDWEEKDEVHPDWQVTTFPARVEVEVGSAGPYPARDGVVLIRPDRFTVDDSLHARNSVNFFGWEPSAAGGTSVLTAVVEPTGQDRSPPRRYESAPLRLDHHTASPTLTLEGQNLLVGSWEDGMPPDARGLTAAILREGADFTRQNFPVVEVRHNLGDLPLSEPFMLSRTQQGDIRVYADLFGTVKQDEYLARQAHDLMLWSGRADMFVVFFPQEIQPRLAGYAYEFPTRTVGIFIPEGSDPQVLSKFVGTLAHEAGHAFGLQHASACPAGAFQECLNRGKDGSDDIEGFRLAPDGGGGSNKSKTEGNAEAPQAHAVLSLMYPDGVPAPVLFMLNEQYERLVGHPRLAGVGWRARPGERADGARVRAGALDLGAGPSVDEGAGDAAWAARQDRPAPAFRSSGDGPWLLVSGLVLPGGDEAVMDPLRVVDELPEGLGGGGDYSVRVLDASGDPVATETFAPVPTAPVHALDEDGMRTPEAAPAVDRGWFWVAVPHSTAVGGAVGGEVAGEVAGVVVARGDVELMRLDRSPNAPTVELREPFVGPEGRLGVEWAGEDEDGDPLAYTLYYSPDGEGSWRGVTPLWTRATRLEVDPARWGKGSRPTLRVVVTDGFRQGEARVRLSEGAR